MLSTPRSLGFVLAIILGAMLVPGCRPDDGLSGPSDGSNLPAPQFAAAQSIPDQYIVVFKSSLPDPAAEARALVAQHGGTLRFTYTAALKGFSAKLPAPALEALSRNPNIDYIEPDQIVRTSEIESVPLNSGYWGLDRIDQRTLPFSGTYSYGSSGAGVHVYILDTGIRYTHTQFGGRAGLGFDAFGGNGADCDGHGTNVAGVVGATAYGVAKAVQLLSVRVLDCTGTGANSGIIAGVDWVTAHRVLPAVANMSMGGSNSSSVNTAIQNSIKTGVVYAVAAGNNSADACSYSPASTPEVLTVGATSNSDGMAGFSNYGSCVDLYAPGATIITSANQSDSAWMVTSGTSIASPFVAGVAALYLSAYPTATPAEVSSAIVDGATPNVVKGLPAGTANRLLYASLMSSPLPPDTTTPLPPPDTTGAPPPPPDTIVSPPVVDQKPLASFTAKCRRGQCTFDASASTDDHGIVSYVWNYGDGTLATGGPTSLKVSHTYATAGTYTVTLTVTDNAGQQGTSSMVLAFRKL